MGTVLLRDSLAAIPDPDTIRRQIGETSNRLSLLRRLLRVAERKAKANAIRDSTESANRREADRAS